MHVLYRRGIHLPGPDLWLDPQDPQPIAVVSHAHADHIQRHDVVLSSVATAAMMRLRGISGSTFRPMRFGHPLQLGDTRVTLYPAGHILGSAQTLVEWGGTRLLYSGDFKLRPGRSTEPAEVPKADVLIMETTFGRPHYRFPDVSEVVDSIRDFCRQALADGLAPVLFCYSLGKGQEVLACLDGVDFPVYLQSSHWDMTSLYRDLGVALPPHRKFQPGQKLNGALLCGSGCRNTAWFRKLARIRTAYISGWAQDSGACWRFGTDAAFPLSDHADYDDLWRYVRLTGARVVHTIHGFADEFAGDLRREGYQAEPLREPPPQLSLF